MNKKVLYINTIIILITIGFSSLYFHEYIEAIIKGWSNYLVYCGDFGQYLTDAEKYAREGINLINTVEVGKDPGFFIITSVLGRIIGTGPQTNIILISFIIYIITTLNIYIGIKRATKKRIMGLIGILIFITIYLNNLAFLYLLSRQLLANLFLLTFIVFGGRSEKNMYSEVLILGLFIAGSMIAHRLGFLLIIINIFLLLAYYLINKNFILVRKISYAFMTGLVLAGPFIFLQISDYLMALEWYLGKNSNNEFISGLENINKIKADGGFSFFQAGIIEEIPLIHYIKYQGLYIILFLSGVNKSSKIWQNKYGKNLIFIFIILSLYALSNLIFRIRALITFEIFLVILCVIFSLNLRKKIYIMMIVNLVIINGILGLSERAIIRGRTFRIDQDPRIEFIKNNIDKDNAFFVGDYCISDFSSQIGYLNANTLMNSPVWKRKENELNGNLHYYLALEMSNILMNSLSKKPYIHESLKGKNIYIIFGYGTSNQVMQSLISGKHPYLQSPYLDLIYSQTQNPLYKGYIFKLKNDSLMYFDNINYLEKNLR